MSNDFTRNFNTAYNKLRKVKTTSLNSPDFEDHFSHATEQYIKAYKAGTVTGNSIGQIYNTLRKTLAWKSNSIHRKMYGKTLTAAELDIAHFETPEVLLSRKQAVTSATTLVDRVCPTAPKRAQVVRAIVSEGSMPAAAKKLKMPYYTVKAHFNLFALAARAVQEAPLEAAPIQAWLYYQRGDDMITMVHNIPEILSSGKQKRYDRVRNRPLKTGTISDRKALKPL